MNTYTATEVQITTSEDVTYRATLSPDGAVSIDRQEPGMWLWAGDGKWDGASIADCSADLGDEAYEMLDEALSDEAEEIEQPTKTLTFGDGYGREVSVKAVGHEQIDEAQAIWDAADDEGTIQAWDARNLFFDPRHHTTMTLAMAFRLSGFEISED